MHEFLLKHDCQYGMSAKLAQYMYEYSKSTEIAHKYADQWSLSRPVKTRAIAPTGTISIVAETTSGIEPIFCTAYQRRFIDDNNNQAYQYVVDPAAARLIQAGVPADKLEDSYVLAADVERRLDFQVEAQSFVDHAISSTINMPAWGSALNNEDTVQKFGEALMKRLPYLRGITLYPDGSRGFQPLTRVDLEMAMKHQGETFVEGFDSCVIGKGGSCGS
jgi:ribonucleoside-diphosphate reductase alpha chain